MTSQTCCILCLCSRTVVIQTSKNAISQISQKTLTAGQNGHRIWIQQPKVTREASQSRHKNIFVA